MARHVKRGRIVSYTTPSGGLGIGLFSELPSIEPHTVAYDVVLSLDAVSRADLLACLSVLEGQCSAEDVSVEVIETQQGEHVV